MTDEIVASDVVLVDLLRKHGTMTVTDLAAALEVTATAIRQRLTRLMAQGFVDRSATKAGRGRPSHSYSLTGKGRRKAGSNLNDLAISLWKEIVAIQDPSVRRVLIQRVSERLAEIYADRVEGLSVGQRMEQLAALFRERRVKFDVEMQGDTPRLMAESCPYPGLADRDRNICAMERQLLTQLLGTRLLMRECRLDGDQCCSFEPEVLQITEPTSGAAAGG
ncbi:MAG: helix-turn-helix transcriptional regulator [Pirellulaceae bacterium]